MPHPGRAVTDAIAPLALLHPDGEANRVLMIGSEIPDLRVPGLPRTATASVDLIIVAPTMSELSTPAWIHNAVERTADVLAADGIALFYLPRRFRGTTMRSLHSVGLRLAPPLLHVPSLAAVRFITPVDRDVLRYAMRNLTGRSSWRQRLSRLVTFAPGFTAAIRRLAPTVGLLARRPGARPTCAWAFNIGDHEPGGSTLVQINWRQPPNGTILHCFPLGHAAPAFVVKVAWNRDRTHTLYREAYALQMLGRAARSASVCIPSVVRLSTGGPHAALVQTAVPGRLSASALRGFPRRFRPLLEQLTVWLAAWNRITLKEKVLDESFIARNLLEPLSIVGRALPEAVFYGDRLVLKAQSHAGISLPSVAAHNDLTMWNVLVQSPCGLGIVDWEAADADGVPMVDFFYAATDAAAATAGYRDRLAALRNCFTAGGTLRHIVRLQERHLQQTLGLSPAASLICFHACWLHHAANAVRASDSAGQRPFLEIVRWLADENQAAGLAVGQ